MKLVLIVEDESLTSDGLVVELKQRQLECHLAKDFGEAIQLLGAHGYDAILIDLMLPEGTFRMVTQSMAPMRNENFGVQLMRNIRNGQFEETGTKRDTPIFVLTAIIERVVRDEVSKLNPEQMFTKPEVPAYIAEHIKLCLEN
jgi:CheY-like chemotaxis protein